MAIEPGSLEDMASGSAVVAGISFVITLGISNVLSYVVALKSTPERRAFYTVMPGILVSVGIGGSMIMGLGMPILSFLFVLLPNLAVFWWFRRQYRRAWMPDDQVPEGVSIENDDWTVGVAGILIVLMIGVFRFVWKTLLGN